MIEKLEVCCLIGEVNFTQVAMLNWQCSDGSISMQHEVDGPVNLVPWRWYDGQLYMGEVVMKRRMLFGVNTRNRKS